MFVRKKPNPSGLISVQVIDKSRGGYRVVKTMGSSSDPAEVKRLVREGKEFISKVGGQQVLDFTLGDDAHFLDVLSDSLQQVRLLGPELVLGRIFDEIGFGQVREEMFRHLVISRLVFPLSKLKTVDYLRSYNGVEYEVDQVYRYLDKLHRSHDELVQQISYRHTVKVLGGAPAVVFYDVTTLYFEADREDDLRVAGFSKEGRHKHPQILIGLLVSVDGYPLAYGMFEGNKFEGHTMMPVIKGFQTRHKLGRPVVIADSGLLSNDNITQLQGDGYEFILGARIKKERAALRERILALELGDGQSVLLERHDGLRLVVSFSAKRAAKDAHNRERGLRRLERDLARGKLTKAQLNNKGYNKFLAMEGEVRVSIDRAKVEQDARWDGLKGYLTNSKLSKEEIIANYSHLWQIEKAFRISKTDLRIRPVYHRLRRRIEAHVCISFCAYKLYKELQRQLAVKKSSFSPERAIELMRTIYGLQLILPQSREPHTMLFAPDPEHHKLLSEFKIEFGCPSA